MRKSDYEAEGFYKWLVANGAEIGSRTTPKELLRFWTHEGIGVVYVNSRDKVTLSGVAGAAYQAFRNKLPWKALPRPRDKRQERFQQWNILSERDGPWCCYCGVWLTFETYTLEHFLAKTHGGTNYYANLGLSCEPCNRALGHLPVAQKIQAAIRRNSKNEALAPKDRGTRQALLGSTARGEELERPRPAAEGDPRGNGSGPRRPAGGGRP